MIGLGLLATLAFVSSVAAPTAMPAATPAVVQQPRPFGYVLGDTLTQRVLLQASGHNFDPAQLPPAERAGLWLARRSSRIDVTEDRHRWLVLDYQLINAPQVLMTVNLPSVTLKPKTGNEILTVPEWPISIAPLTPRTAFAKGGLQELRPDHPAPMLPTDALRRQLEMSSGVLALSVGAWLTWWLVRSIRAAATQPFARAMREIRRNGDNDDPGAWLALHRAFDKTAQRTLQLSTLPAFFEQAPHFETQRTAIEHFYAESYQRFFGVGGTRAVGVAPTATEAALPPRALCAILRRIEKQNER